MDHGHKVGNGPDEESAKAVHLASVLAVLLLAQAPGRERLNGEEDNEEAAGLRHSNG